jgi:hypothetical protein
MTPDEDAQVHAHHILLLLSRECAKVRTVLFLPRAVQIIDALSRGDIFCEKKFFPVDNTAIS